MQTANSLYAIVHAKYGKHLKNEDYKALLNSKSVSDVAAYLRSHTIYSKALDSINRNDLHRGYLEQLIKQQLINEENEIAGFEKGINVEYYKYTFAKNSINELLSFLRLMSSGREKEYVLFMPKNQADYPAIDLKKLSESNDLQGVINSLKDKELKNFIEPQIPDLTMPDGKVDFTTIEFLFNDYLLQFGLKLAKSYGRKPHTEMLQIYGTWSDLENVERIYRMKRLGITDDIYMRKFLFKNYYKLTPKIINQMLNAKNEDEVFEIFNLTYYKKYKGSVRYHDINSYSRFIYYRVLKHYFTFSSEPMVNVIAFNKLCDYEVQNLYRIIEGIRYGLDRNEILKSLVGYREV